MEGKFVAYYRVSTKRQSDSGLGLDAQKKAVTDYLNGGPYELLGEFTESESGKKDERPQLSAALDLAKATGSILVIAKLDRLSRNAAFLFNLRDAGVEFICADNPHANKLTIGILAVIAEDERERISQRTKAALQAAKDRGQQLGCPKGAAHLRQYGNAHAVAGIKTKADKWAAGLRSHVEAIKALGTTSFLGIANELNRRGILTPRSKKWHASSVQNLLARLDSSFGCPVQRPC